MGINRYLPHVFVLPEDDRDRQLAIGFLLDENLAISKIQVLPEAGGWSKVLDLFKSDHICEMERYPHRFMVLLIDFDGKQDRLGQAKAKIPGHLIERVFVLGAWTDPEDLRAKLGSYETIGKLLAKDCREGTDTTWGHDLLRHNASEIDRLRRHVRPILFESI
jgi:hypothetical protein